MYRRDFIKTTGFMAAGASLGSGLVASDLWAKLPTLMKITGLKTMIVEDEVYLKIFTNQGVVGEGHATVHRKARTCQAAIHDLTDVLVGKDPTRIEFLKIFNKIDVVRILVPLKPVFAPVLEHPHLIRKWTQILRQNNHCFHPGRATPSSPACSSR